MAVRPRRACLAPELHASNPFASANHEAESGSHNSHATDGLASTKTGFKVPRGKLVQVDVCLPVPHPVRLLEHPKQCIRDLKQHAWSEFFRKVLLAPDQQRPATWWHNRLSNEDAHELYTNGMRIAPFLFASRTSAVQMC
ncbi:hypothetical protein PTSG_12634 [Salpingoeca rosetta]|uniref:Uncharacterized protein n=1 Tax=Salpingoeca rosetta (strain ATCC 50818 / BSB-021) TaxID=946362 RepID=F2UG99_SALR5|nr:uncharacterized protein PTSG_12634 [Salpingoeca rosetta]EGD75649.1 hypothetical protein PTSG_12634 [Salpingoeca rosetta]|eukprot:XP_004991570.1 hypothetical protein PTSG_12634 [Salpingoeca rosetta]